MRLGYARVSTEKQSEDEPALEHHLARLDRAKCDRIFYDIASGGDPVRAQFLELIATAKELRAQNEEVTIVFARLDRWSRDLLTSLRTVEELEGLGIILEELDVGRVSVKTAGDWLNTSQRALFAEYERRQIRERVSRAIDYKRSLNHPICSAPIWGWKLTANKAALEPNLELLPIVLSLFEAYADGKTSLNQLVEIAKPHGGPSTASSMSRWLLHPVHQGCLWYSKGGINRPDRSSREGLKSEHCVIIPNCHEPIISPSLANQIKQVLTRKQKLWGANSLPKVNPLRGLCFCFQCNKSLCVHRAIHRKKIKGKGIKEYFYSYLRCENCERKKFIRYSIVEKVLIEVICSKAEKVSEGFLQSIEIEESAETLLLKQQLSELQSIRKRTGLASLDGAISEIQAQISKMNESAKQPDSFYQFRMEILRAVSSPQFFDLMTDEEKSQVYSALVKRVVVDLSQKTVLAVDLLL